jgi:hypothetical protein
MPVIDAAGRLSDWVQAAPRSGDFFSRGMSSMRAPDMPVIRRVPRWNVA